MFIRILHWPALRQRAVDFDRLCLPTRERPLAT
jgi:hypothetical protein